MQCSVDSISAIRIAGLACEMVDGEFQIGLGGGRLALSQSTFCMSSMFSLSTG